MPSSNVRVLRRPPYYGDRIEAGLQRLGYTPGTTPRRGDVLVLWNRYPRDERLARTYEKVGGSVVVVENGYFGRNFNGTEWYAVAKGQHGGAGQWPEGSRARWASLGIDLKPWRPGGDEIVILASRGMGSALCAQPPGWLERITAELKYRTKRPVRVRAHPGPQADCSMASLEEDLASAHAAVTWASGAGLKALALGVPVFNASTHWIGAGAARPIGHDIEGPFLGDRGPMFHNVATAMWSLAEIESGEAFARLKEF